LVRERLLTYVLYRISPVATGRIWWALPPKQSSKPPQIETWNTTNKWSFG